ncbi:MAG: type II toxin-antitoxin system prevent-host-death family antitoxin [Acidobacteriota bacterium]|nr:type II toxin-antitoxin system prevent-host-death family antitoxin [Acidobacteriota bacterium]
MLVNMHQAKSQLSKLIVAAEAGDEVIIARRGKPAVRLVPVTSKTFRFGSLAHLVKSVPDFDGATKE